MGGLLIAEWRKTRSVRLWWALLIPACVLSALINGSGGALVSGGAFGAGTLADRGGAPAMATALSVGGILVMVFGIASVTSEFRHHTISTTYLIGGSRVSVLAAKAVLAAGIGVGFALAIELVGVPAALLAPASSRFGDPLQLAALCVIGLLVLAAWAVFGVLVGTVVSNELAATTGALAYLLLVENGIQAILARGRAGAVSYYLPGEAPGAALTSLARGDAVGGPFAEIPPWWVAVVVFAGYTAILGAVGWARTRRRDVR